MHLPFCETLCTFCGCNTVITRNHERSAPYVETVLAELDLYLRNVPVAGDATRVADAPRRRHADLHAARCARDAAEGDLSRGCRCAPTAIEGSVEVDPRVTTRAHLEAMRALGISRISLGVQDFDTEVLRLVNRPQPIEMTAALCAEARACGYDSINFDLIYGLPGQSVIHDDAARRRRARLAARSARGLQLRARAVDQARAAKFKDEDVPVGAEKRELYETLRDRLLAAGYLEIGLDHFALPHDALAPRCARGTLHRNFMGYTDRRTTALLGLGVSAISETPACYHQNEKVITVYERRIGEGEMPTLRGHVLSDDDRKRADVIRALMTTGRAPLDGVGSRGGTRRARRSRARRHRRDRRQPAAYHRQRQAVHSQRRSLLRRLPAYTPRRKDQSTRARYEARPGHRRGHFRAGRRVASRRPRLCRDRHRFDRRDPAA